MRIILQTIPDRRHVHYKIYCQRGGRGESGGREREKFHLSINNKTG